MRLPRRMGERAVSRSSTTSKRRPDAAHSARRSHSRARPHSHPRDGARGRAVHPDRTGRDRCDDGARAGPGHAADRRDRRWRARSGSPRRRRGASAGTGAGMRPWLSRSIAPSKKSPTRADAIDMLAREPAVDTVLTERRIRSVERAARTIAGIAGAQDPDSVFWPPSVWIAPSSTRSIRRGRSTSTSVAPRGIQRETTRRSRRAAYDILPRSSRVDPRPDFVWISTKNG